MPSSSANQECPSGATSWPSNILFVPAGKTPRLNRSVYITEKIDGTRATVFITPISKESQDPFCLDYWYGPDASTWGVYAGSRMRWLQPGKQDNYGFAAWVKENIEELKKLGPGRHDGEWWGRGIQRNYGLTERRFSLFNAGRWGGFERFNAVPPDASIPGVIDLQTTVLGPACCHVVPTIWRGNFDLFDCRAAVEMLRVHGSFAAPGFKDPEGICIYHEAAKKTFKVTLVGDESPKSCLTTPEPVRD